MPVPGSCAARDARPREPSPSPRQPFSLTLSLFSPSLIATQSTALHFMIRSYATLPTANSPLLPLLMDRL
eukprot:7389445-Prymnesium_polylepis.1